MKKGIVLIMLIISAIGYSQDWKTNFEEAKAAAAKENKNILLVFSGSDWCAPCIKLEKVVWKSEVFKQYSEKKLILLRADFPNKRANQLPKEIAEGNKKLSEKYNKEGNFPLVVLIDKSGKVIGMTGFKNVTAEEYVKLIESLNK
ncbi:MULTISPECIES: thioredoxin family protein [Flavobacterium]|uniref:Thioredoxin domain-containing protein n=2 Tax=Flavobacterium TaxID=237 RepID=A0ABP7UX84_9FLAO